MLRYIVKRCLYAVLTIFGVMLLTFVLFRMSAGDPAETLLGKNPTPRDVESLRARLGTDKPLFWGRLKRTECFSSADFRNGRTNFPGVTYQGRNIPGKDALELVPGSEILFPLNFEPDGGKVRAEVRADGPVVICGKAYQPDADGIAAAELCPVPSRIVLSVPADAAGNTGIRGAAFYVPNSSPWNSQLADSFREVISFSSEFPYVRCFDFGNTLLTREPISRKLRKGMGPSLCVMLPVFFGELFCGIVLAMMSCAFHGRWPDWVICVLSVAGMSVSYLVLILAGQWFLAYYLNLFPVWGWGELRHIALPVMLGIVSGTGGGVRFYRSVFLDELNREYLRTAYAKGVSASAVYMKHLLRNAVVPIITRASTTLPFLFTGSLLLESFFGIPGLGYEGINALHDSDLQMLKALVLTGAFLFVLINLLTDIACAWSDPRMRVAKTE